jgi:hypothetical protein
MIVAAVGRPPQISSKKLLARHRLSAESRYDFIWPLQMQSLSGIPFQESSELRGAQLDTTTNSLSRPERGEGTACGSFKFCG